jgi:signal transduction histidine kinase
MGEDLGDDQRVNHRKPAAGSEVELPDEGPRRAESSGVVESGAGSSSPDVSWQEKALESMLRATVATTVLALTAVTPMLLREKRPGLVLAYWSLTGGVIALSRLRLAYRWRRAGMVLLMYLIALLVSFGEQRPFNIGVILCAWCSLCVLLGGIGWGIVALVVSAATITLLAAVHLYLWSGPAMAMSGQGGVLETWISYSVLWAVTSVMVCISIWQVVSRLERALGQSRELTARLREKVRQRDEAIAARRETEGQLVHAQKMDLLGKLAGGIAHDFNNLLTAITIGTDLSLHAAAGPEVRQSLMLVKDAADQSARLTERLLALSRRAVAQPLPLDINELVRDAARVITRLVRQDIRVDIFLHRDPLVVICDPVQFQQLLLNLVVNARDAMPGGGDLTVSTRRFAGTPPQMGRMAPRPAASYAVLEVVDTGLGMDEHTLSRAFEPFYTTKPPGQGTGLGLSTALAIVDGYGGSIAVRSTPGRSTVFEIYLPLTSAPAVTRSSQQDPAPPVGRERVLVVDDHILVRAVMCAALGDVGYQVVDAGTPGEAIQLASTASPPFDLLVTDVVMPGMSGPELASRLKGVHPELRVLYCSGYAHDLQTRRAFGQEQDAFLQKPFTRDSLLRRVRALLDAPGDR